MQSLRIDLPSLLIIPNISIFNISSVTKNFIPTFIFAEGLYGTWALKRWQKMLPTITFSNFQDTFLSSLQYANLNICLRIITKRSDFLFILCVDIRHQNPSYLFYFQHCDISWKHIVHPYAWDLSNNRYGIGLCKMPWLTEGHINLTPRLQMKVKLAAQVKNISICLFKSSCLFRLNF